jgi:hypothetical protein
VPLLAGAAILVWSGVASADNPFHLGSGQAFVFQSGGSDNHPGVSDFGAHPFDHYTRVLPLGTTTLHLYATGGHADSLPGEVLCQGGPGGGSGDEICGFDVEITLTGPAHVSDFRAAGPPGGDGIRTYPMSGFGPTVTGSSGVVVSVTDGGMVLANRQTIPMNSTLLAVPEPGVPWMLGVACLGLALLYRLRRPVGA